METIPSFKVDHTKLTPGIYVSRVDTVGGSAVTTYDLRMTTPNTDPVIDTASMHTLEHILATVLRSDSRIKDDVIYVGPMGCHTGMYLILKGTRKPEEIRNIVIGAMYVVCGWEGPVPGATPERCGNHSLQNLGGAVMFARRYITALKDDFRSEYVTLPD